jgi:hypothetical protein
MKKLLACLAVLSLSSSVFAKSDLTRLSLSDREDTQDNTLRAEAANPIDTHSPNPFDDGSWTFQSYASVTWGEHDNTLAQVHVGGGYFFIDGLSINLQLVGSFLHSHDVDDSGEDGDPHSGDDSGAGGLDALFRWHFLRDKEEGRWSIFADAGAGIMVSSESFPADGSHFNFTPQAGLGGTLRLTDRLHLIGGVKWYHVSNAYTQDRNPGYDGVQGYLGVMIPF